MLAFIIGMSIDHDLAHSRGYLSLHRDLALTLTLAMALTLTLIRCSVWLPVTDATLDNGCMYVVPKEFDPEFELGESQG